MPYRSTLGLALALALFVASWIGVSAPNRDLVVRHPVRRGVSMIYLAPAPDVPDSGDPGGRVDDEGDPASGADVSADARDAAAAADLVRVPGVLVAHGRSASKQLMLGFGQALAHAGFAVLLWDQPGHGANVHRFRAGALRIDLETARQVLLEQPEVDPDRVALLGHAMGAAAVLAAGAEDLDRYRATIAVSPPPGTEVGSAPANVLLLAGSRETRLVRAARDLLEAYGGVRRGFEAGLARDLVVIGGAGHLSVLLHDVAHRAAVDWLTAAIPTIEADPEADPEADLESAAPGPVGDRDVARLAEVRGAVGASEAYVDRRVQWYALSLLACISLLASMTPAARPDERHHMVSARGRRDVVGLVVGAVVATATVAGLAGPADLTGIGGMMYAGALSLWFGIAGAIWLLVGFRIRRPRRKDLIWVVFVFGLVWLGTGALAQQAWLQWGLTTARLLRWPLWAALCLPWFLAMEAAPGSRGAWARATWWLAECVVVVAGLTVLVVTTPELAVVGFVLPFLPVVFGLLAIAGRVVNRVWGFGLGAALAFGWILAAVFPYTG